VGHHQVMFNNVNEIASEEKLDEWYTYQVNQRKKVVYLLPSAKWLTTARANQPGLSFMTFDDLADIILRELSIEYKVLPDDFRYLFFQDDLQNNPTVEDVREIPYQAKAYGDTYGQLKRLGLTIQQLPETLQSLQSSFEKYEDNFISKHYLDSENKLITAIKLLREKYTLPSINVVIEGYIDFTPLQYELLIALFNQNIPITVYLPKINASLIQQTTKDLKDIGFHIQEYGPKPFKRVEKQFIIQAVSPEEEIHRILDLIYEKKQTIGSYDQIAIVLANEASLEELMTIAEEKKIPIKRAKKKSLSHTLIIQTLKQILVEKKLPTKWDRLEEISSISKLLFLEAAEYTKLKQIFIDKEIICFEEVEQIHNQFQLFIETIFSGQTVVKHCQNFIGFLQSIPLLSSWKNMLSENPHRESGLQISFEWRTYVTILSFLQKWIKDLEELPVIKMEGTHFLSWFFNRLEVEELYLKRTPLDAIGIYTFRDIALFKGSEIFVLGLNEGVYPPAYSLSGYFQPQHLENLEIRYGSPTVEIFEKKAEALFNQLEVLAETISFSYCIGVDSHEPLLPSKYIAPLINKVEKIQASFQNRMQIPFYEEKQELMNKVAYHIGKDYLVKNTLDELKEKQNLLITLAIGNNSLSEPLSGVRRSVTAIESYVDCSFKFAMDYVLKVKPVIERVTSVDRRKTGILLHNVIEKFYKKIGFIEKSFLDCAKELTEDKDRILLEIFEQEWAGLEKELLIDLSEVVVKEEKLSWMKKIKRWWVSEKLLFQNEQLQNMQIYMMEKGLSFTLNNDLVINIKADRVDIDEDGFVIYDYKSSNKMIKENEVMDGKVLQLPLYLYALKDILKEKVGRPLRPYGASYINVDNPKSRASNSMWEANESTLKRFNVHSKAMKVEMKDGEHLNRFGLHTKLNELVKDSKQQFRVNPYGTNSCQYCTYHAVCRVTPETFEGE
jgi:ATP-dependent helicase/nuclease subunit B